MSEAESTPGKPLGFEKKIKCSNCQGTGKVIPDGATEPADCPTCGGSGTITLH